MPARRFPSPWSVESISAPPFAAPGRNWRLCWLSLLDLLPTGGSDSRSLTPD